MLENDSFGSNPQVVDFTQPSVGSVELVDGRLVAFVPPSFAGELTFSYTISDESGTTSTADVTVSSVNVLDEAGQLTDLDQPVNSVSDVLSRLANIFSSLISVRLNSVQLGFLGLGPFFLGLTYYLFSRRELLLSVTNTAQRSAAAAVNTGSEFALRHDALVWTTGKTRVHDGVPQIRIDLPDGRTFWVNKNLVVDTGY